LDREKKNVNGNILRKRVSHNAWGEWKILGAGRGRTRCSPQEAERGRKIKAGDNTRNNRAFKKAIGGPKPA